MAKTKRAYLVTTYVNGEEWSRGTPIEAARPWTAIYHALRAIWRQDAAFRKSAMFSVQVVRRDVEVREESRR